MDNEGSDEMPKVVKLYDEKDQRMNTLHRSLCTVIEESPGDLTIWEIVGVLESMKHDILLSPRGTT